MSSTKVDIEYVRRTPIVSADEKPRVERESPAPSATSLSGEWIPLPEAIAWIIFRDFGKARHLRKASHSRMSLEYGFAQAGIDPTSPVMAPREAQVELMDALRQGAILAMGCRYLGNGEIILLGPEQWAHLKFEDHAVAPWGAACERTLAFFCDLLVNANRLLETFPESIERAEDEALLKAEAPGSLSTRSPGRPTNMRLAETEMRRRASERELAGTLKDESMHLSAHIGRMYPGETPPAPKTIQNQLGSLYRELSKGLIPE